MKPLDIKIQSTELNKLLGLSQDMNNKNELSFIIDQNKMKDLPRIHSRIYPMQAQSMGYLREKLF